MILMLCSLSALSLLPVAAHGAVYSPGGGVYGDASPRDAGGEPVFAVVPSQDVNPDYYITQTVYGFLDFTTTIGNTVMIFSPQSAAPAVTGNQVQRRCSWLSGCKQSINFNSLPSA